MVDLNFKKAILFLLVVFCQLSGRTEKIIKIACVGNSITYGSGIVNRDKNSYPAQLQYYLGDKYKVVNFGVSGATVLSEGDFPYISTKEYNESKAFQPDIVLIKLGTNDSKAHNWKFSNSFLKDYKRLVNSYISLKSKPRVILLTPVRCYLDESPNINPRIIRHEIKPLIESFASKKKIEIIDLYEVFGDDWDVSLMPDKIHPSSLGAGMIANKIGNYIDRQILNECVHAIPGNEYRSAAGWSDGAEWHIIAEDICNTLKGRNIEILFIGNSITQGWGGERKCVTYKPGKEIMDRLFGNGNCESAGISGDRTQNVLWRIEHDGYNSLCHPKNVIISVGINNLIGGGNSPSDTADGILAVAKAARKEFVNSRIILLGVLPSGHKASSEIRKKCDEVHCILSKNPIEGVEYINPSKWFLDNDGDISSGLYLNDYIHLTSKGYGVWAENILNVIKR